MFLNNKKGMVFCKADLKTSLAIITPKSTLMSFI